MLKVGGIWVSPFEVESALAAHDAVLEAAVVGHADERRAREAAGVRRAQAAGHAGDEALADELQGAS